MTKHKNSLKPATLVVSVGGSIVVPNGEINTKFLNAFKKLIEAQIAEGWRFVIVVGGGGTARTYQSAARAVGTLAPDDADWLGIHATRLNGHLLRTIFREHAHPIMFKNPASVPKKMTHKIIIGAGWRPGASTDSVAVRIAKRLGASVVLNLSNIDYLYDKDPRKHADATPICDIDWKEFRKMVGDTWDPGMNAPFDPIASRIAQRAKIKVALLNGTNLKNLDNLLSGKPFLGTIIG